MLEVKLAGYNVDTDVVEKLKKTGWDGRNNITPETISAAYARISRDPRPVTELRADARDEVDKARKSNEAIVFKMGHHSVAEHAYLNFDILGLSRLAVESLEEARLCSYTEKSQRYITLQGDYVTPAELPPQEKKVFDSCVSKQVEAYKTLFPALHALQKRKFPKELETKSGANLLEGWAKEDARYALALATECQLGFSSNSRNLEHIIRKFKYSPLAEVRQLGAALYSKANEIVPSLIILSDAEAFKKQFGKDVSDGILKTGRETAFNAVKKMLKGSKAKKLKGDKDVSLVDFTKDADTRIIAAMMHSNSVKTYAACLDAAGKMGKSGRKKFIRLIFKDLSEHDTLYREFEAANFIFEIKISSSAFGQLKRHRMMTILKQPYDISLGYTMPPSIIEAGRADIFKKVMDETRKAYLEISKTCPLAAGYVLTNAHRRRVLVNTNLRELYHIARLRMDWHAQWDIQNISAAMVKEAVKAAPLSAALACGKDKFKEVKEAFFK